MRQRISEAQKQELLPRLIYAALGGRTPAEAGKVAGVKRDTASRWLQAAGVDWKALTVRCPSCEGTMERGEFFLWRCHLCGAEWWPPERAVPEDPDRWASVADSVAPAVVAVLDRLRAEGLSYEQIADRLNADGVTSAYGRRWTWGRVAQYLAAHAGGRRAAWREREPRVRAIMEAMARDGYGSKLIAERLNAEGLLTMGCLPWNSKRVRDHLRKWRIRITPAGTHKVRYTGVGRGERHPWRLDNERRFASRRASS